MTPPVGAPHAGTVHISDIIVGGATTDRMTITTVETAVASMSLKGSPVSFTRITRVGGY